ncbi:MAG: exodeoxyribonuclease VII small subunit [Verrucomicrobiota bacterium]|nr:exodeoxyribonuclease VII small subunit [Verrucomicrobiota bacterium]
MSEAGKAAQAGSKPDSELGFEEALGKLRAIVEMMENDDLRLETLLTKYEEGSQLIQVCSAKLNEAELKVQQLERSSSGKTSLKPFPLSE